MGVSGNISNEFYEYIDTAIQKQKNVVNESVSRLLNLDHFKNKHMSLDEEAIRQRVGAYLEREIEREPLLNMFNPKQHVVKGNIKLEKLYEIMSKYDEKYKCRLNGKHGEDVITGVKDDITIEFTKDVGPSFFRMNHVVKINIFIDWEMLKKRYTEVFNKFGLEHSEWTNPF